MRRWIVFVAAFVAGCSILVDTSGLTGGPAKGVPDGGAALTDGAPGPGGSEGGTEGGAPFVRKPPPTKWTRIADAPVARHSARGVFDTKRSVVLIYGGLQGPDRKNDAYEWDGATWTHRTYDVSPERQSFAFGWDPKRNVAVLMGGQYIPGDLWELDGTTWTNKGLFDLPKRSAGIGGAFDTKRGRLIAFGGIISEQQPLDDTWAWDGTTLMKLTPAKSPPPVRGHSMAYDEARDRVVVFGGYDTVVKSVQGDTWTFDGATWTSQTLIGPTARSGACMAYDAARQLVVMVAGRHENANELFDETWLWDGTTWQAGPKGPPARRSCTLVYDARREQIVLYGGNGGAASLSDAWTLD